MWNTIALKKNRFMLNLQEKIREIETFIDDSKERHKPFLTKCAIIFMIMKIGLISLATFSAVVFIILSVTPRLCQEMTRTNAFLLASPLTLILGVKIYFIGKMLLTYDRSRFMIQSAIDGVLFKSRRGLQQIETFRLGLPSPLADASPLRVSANKVAKA
jgi:hypothetical protein